ncbi:MAG: type II toxin-antitoxin system VapC family toxin [Acidobacteria bacterium]|nr:type II toxin-antitoxin system VapC family toxin [Acidobacteriota bacterium]
MSRIFLDTNIFIYIFENHPQYGKDAAILRNRIHERGDELITSWMTVAEVQIRPRATGNDGLAALIKQLIIQGSTIIGFDEAAAETYTQIRINTGIKGPDAIQLACAAAAGVELFVTNDQRLARLRIPGIHFITSLDRVPI